MASPTSSPIRMQAEVPRHPRPRERETSATLRDAYGDRGSPGPTPSVASASSPAGSSRTACASCSAYAGNWDSHDYIEQGTRLAHPLGRQAHRGPPPRPQAARHARRHPCRLVLRRVRPHPGQRPARRRPSPTGATTTPMPWRCGSRAGARRPGTPSGPPTTSGRRRSSCVHHIRDVHVTLLHLLGLDDNQLTYYHAGRHKQLSQFGGQVITELLA